MSTKPMTEEWFEDMPVREQFLFTQMFTFLSASIGEGLALATIDHFRKSADKLYPNEA